MQSRLLMLDAALVLAIDFAVLSVNADPPVVDTAEPILAKKEPFAGVARPYIGINYIGINGAGRGAIGRAHGVDENGIAKTDPRPGIRAPTQTEIEAQDCLPAFCPKQ